MNRRRVLIHFDFATKWSWLVASALLNILFEQKNLGTDLQAKLTNRAHDFPYAFGEVPTSWLTINIKNVLVRQVHSNLGNIPSL